MTHAHAAPPRSTLYGQAELARLIAPRRVAVLGASTRAGSFGERTVANLARFEGEVFPVNPKYDEIAGRRCYPSLVALPQPPDLVVIVSNREVVHGMVEDCVEAGAGGILIYASGYGETGKPERAAQQAALSAIARASGVPIVGPNCIGIHNLQRGLAATFTAAIQPLHHDPSSAVGLISQSGALGNSLLQAGLTGNSISHILTSGNSCDVDVADLIAYLAEDEGCRAIGCIFEGMSDPGRLMAAAERARDADKPLVIYKIAVGEEGSAAALSHTGSLAGSNAAYQAAFDRAGIVVVDDLEALVETTRMFAKAGRMRAPGVAIVSTSGGASIIAADKAEAHGVALPQPDADARRVLEARIPEYGSSRNPCDVTAQVMADPGSLSACCEALLACPSYGAMVVPHVLADQNGAARMPVFNELARRHDKLVCVVWLSSWWTGPGSFEAETMDRLVLFRSSERCFAAIAAWQRREAGRGLDRTPGARRSPADAPSVARGLLGAAGDRVLTERQSKEVLAAYEIAVTRETLARTAGEAVDAAARLGFPVVLKIESADIPHKSDAGVIRLNLRDADAVRDAFDAVSARAAAVVPTPRVEGVLVQQMIPAGLEIVVGARIDPQFGPLVLVGLGGVLVELVRDTVLALAPVSQAQALGMLASLKGARALDGFRGSEPVDRDTLADTIVRVSELASDLRHDIVELDVNPVLCAGRSVVAVDALLVRADV